MELKSCRVALAACLALVFLPGTTSAGERERNAAALQNLNHIIVVMQENHSFDNYFGALAYVPGGVYHAADADRGHGADSDRGDDDLGGCRPDDHRCVDGLTCKVAGDGTF